MTVIDEFNLSQDVATVKHLDSFNYSYILIFVFIKEVAKALINLSIKKSVHVVG